MVAAVVIGAALLPPGSRAVAQERVRLATLNCEFLIRSKVHIKFGLPFDLEGHPDEARWDQPAFREARFQEAVKAVAAVIRRLDADVIALCEVGAEADVEALRRAVRDLGLDYPHAAVCTSTDTVTGQHVAVLSKRPLEQVIRVIPGRESYFTELDDPEAEDDTGVSKGMRVVFRVAGRPLHFYAVHLASERGGNEQDAQRIAQASIVRRHYLGPLNRGILVVVAGDLNDGRGQPALRRIRGQDDIDGDLIQTGAVPFFPQDKLDTRWTYEFQGVREQIDHILLSQSVKEACRPQGGIRSEVVPVTETIDGTQHPATDHRGLVVTLNFE